jgi:nucleotide-binding universal stress UspA family protein
MTKRILAVLDPDDETPVVLDTAIEIAQRHQGEVTCVALVDTGAIDAEATGGGIGSMYYAERLREQLQDETRTKARGLLAEFTSRLDEAGVTHTRDHVAEGGRVESLVYAMRTHDLLVTGRESHFYYAEPEKRTRTLAKVLEHGAAATLIVGREPLAVRRVLVAYDGETAAARTLQKFAHLSPFGVDIAVDLVHLCGDSEAKKLKSERLLDGAASFLLAYGFSSVTATSLEGMSTSDRLQEYTEASGADLIVAGAYSSKGIRKLLFGSTAIKLLNDATTPLFLYS